MKNLSIEIIDFEMLNLIEIAQLQRIEQLNKFINTDYRILYAVKYKGKINSQIGVYIQKFQIEKEYILNHSSLITEELKEQQKKEHEKNCLNLKNSWNKKQKTHKQLTLKNLENLLGVQLSEPQKENKTKEEMKPSTSTLKLQKAPSYKNMVKAFMQNS